MISTARPKTKWFYYLQTNSHGVWKDQQCVFVEALGPIEANEIAEDIGPVYFDPEFKIDCRCCGTRWSALDINDKPMDFQGSIEEAAKELTASYRLSSILIIPYGASDGKELRV